MLLYKSLTASPIAACCLAMQLDQGFTNYTAGTGYEAREPDSIASGATANRAFDSSLYGGASQVGVMWCW